VHHNDVVVAFAMYNEIKQAVLVPPRVSIFDIWWAITTHGGVGPGPGGPWSQEIGVALALADMANSVAPALRSKLLEVALEQLSVASDTIRQQISRTPRKYPAIEL